MRKKIVIGAAVALSTVLLAGCGSDGDSSKKGKDHQADKAGKADKSVSEGVNPKQDGAAAGDGAAVKREVTLEVRGSGSSKIYYNLDSNKMETVKLPWKKTSTITLETDAEKKVGLGVSVVPGSVTGPDGMLRPADCVITVDGKQVADNSGGKSMCEYTVK
ncbi:hypothetical protein H8N01_02635 [Streptomyces sp. AC536]|uniref:hypothetical protein n=1 Tax=Streptomyces buecherae TaxID=2763006 RepID=UPI00164DC969|nr:hypothetical protein [Streptomyces buecherae]MBC3981495.1 hypothetical protein [Streptomyces buecherae]QNJ41221.1 hypothetical protein H7H31_16465 [Streptomyces buecherae]